MDFWNRRLLLTTMLTACLALPRGAGGADAVAREYAIKAAFIYHFVQFVEWPAETFAAADSPLVIGILGQNPFQGALEQAIKDKQAQGRKLQLKRYADASAVEGCHVLFVSSSERERLGTVFEKVSGKSVLTIGDVEGFTRAGGMVRFFSEENKVRFEVRPKAAERAKLKISSKLLKLAKIYEE